MPAVRVTRVLPTFRTVNAPGALISYQSFLLKGSTLQTITHRVSPGASLAEEQTSRSWCTSTHAFFPFFPFPLLIRLFLPTAMVKGRPNTRLRMQPIQAELWV